MLVQFHRQENRRRIMPINISDFDNYLDQMYHIKLEIKDKTYGEQHL